MLACATAAMASRESSWLAGEPSHESRFESILPAIREFPPHVRDAFAANIALGSFNWAWTERVTKQESDTLSRWNPVAPPDEKIVLMEIDGHSPSPEEEEEFRAEQKKELDATAEERPALSQRMAAVVRAMRFEFDGAVDDGLRYVLDFNEPDYAGLGFIDRAFVRVVTQVGGSLVVDGDDDKPGFVKVRLKNPKPIPIILGIGIRDFEVSIDSEYVPEARTWMPVAMAVEVQGNAWIFGRIARSLQFEFSDYENVGLPPLPSEVVLGEKTESVSPRL